MPRQNRFPCSFAFRLDEAAAEQLRSVAKAHGFLAGEYARKVVSAAVALEFRKRGVRYRVLHAELLRSFLAELARQGSNLNQIAHGLNINRVQGLATDTTRLAADLISIRANNDRLVAAILVALGASEAP